MSAQDFTGVNDYDLANILYINRIPAVPDDQRTALNAVIQNVITWEAFETAKVETTVQGKVQGNMLPNDASAYSKMKRTTYRAQVLDHLRRSYAWCVFLFAQTLTGSMKGCSLRRLVAVSKLSRQPIASSCITCTTVTKIMRLVRLF
jgi:hypothetical protein